MIMMHMAAKEGVKKIASTPRKSGFPISKGELLLGFGYKEFDDNNKGGKAKIVCKNLLEFDVEEVNPNVNKKGKRKVLSK